MKTKLAISAFVTCLFASSAYAGPVSLTETQLDTVAGGAFVCPVISTDGVLNSPKSMVINGANTIIGPTVSVPVHATNDNGAGSPGGTFASPGDTSYTAIWN